MNYREPDPSLYKLPFAVDEFHGMPFLRMGRSGLRASKAGLGTWKMGFPETGDGARTDEGVSLAILDRAWEIGVTFWDTANRYNESSGNSERVIGTWFERNPEKRRDIVLCTKICGLMDGLTPNHSGLGRGNIRDGIHACLERLLTDRIDLLYFHQFDDTTPPEESLETVEDLVSEGTVRYFGVSNFSVEQLEIFRAIEASSSLRCRVIAVQNKFDILAGENPAHEGALAYAAENGISFVAYSPLARGLLSDRYLEPEKSGEGDRLFDEKSLETFCSPDVMDKLRRLSELAKEWDVPTSRLALAYMHSLPGMGPSIVSASTIEQLETNAAAATMELAEDQIESMAKVLSG
jgi:aryl-alcohol dehydrogenase-like predicted oxidoreductase